MSLTSSGIVVLLYVYVVNRLLLLCVCVWIFFLVKIDAKKNFIIEIHIFYFLNNQHKHKRFCCRVCLEYSKEEKALLCMCMCAVNITAVDVDAWHWVGTQSRC
jgi:hypothetical protein